MAEGQSNCSHLPGQQLTFSPAVLFLRTYALYSGNRKIYVFLVLLYVVRASLIISYPTMNTNAMDREYTYQSSFFWNYTSAQYNVRCPFALVFFFSLVHQSRYTPRANLLEGWLFRGCRKQDCIRRLCIAHAPGNK
jgi:hypothetical protein